MKRLKRNKYKAKHTWATGIFLFVILGSGAAGINFMVQLNNELKEIAKEDMPIMEMITQITVHKLEQTHWFERALRHAEMAVHGQENNEEVTVGISSFVGHCELRVTSYGLRT